MGDHAEALRNLIESLAQYRGIGDVAGEALALNNIGSLQVARGDFASATLHLKPGLALCERHGLVNTRALILANLTDVGIKSGDLDSAQRHAAKALEIAEVSGNRYLASFMKLQFARFALRRGDLPAARSELGAALTLAIAIGHPALLLEGVDCFAELLAAQGEPDCERLLREFARAPSTVPRLELGELAHRIVVEADAAHAPLIALLRGAA